MAQKESSKGLSYSLDNNYYFVPSSYAGTEVEISLSAETVRIYTQKQMVATY